MLTYEDEQAFARGRIGADALVWSVDSDQGAGKGGVLLLTMDPLKSMRDGAAVSPRSLWKSGHAGGNRPEAGALYDVAPVTQTLPSPSPPPHWRAVSALDTARHVSALPYRIEDPCPVLMNSTFQFSELYYP